MSSDNSVPQNFVTNSLDLISRLKEAGWKYNGSGYWEDPISKRRCSTQDAFSIFLNREQGLKANENV